MKKAAVHQRIAETRQKRRSPAITNGHERQARVAAVRILSGEIDVARLLTTAPAARRVESPYRYSSGEPLPGQIREKLEIGYNADLRAVRLHTDEAGAEAALLEGALAFTSGRDIYFAPGQYQPTTHDGIERIAHEVAHVLQQTGRVEGADGVLTASDRHGSAGMQHDKPEMFSYPFNKFADDYRLFATVEDDSPETKIALEKVLATVQVALSVDGHTLIEEASGKGDAFKMLADEVAARTKGLNSTERREKAKQWWDMPAFARSALMDVMKFSHNFEAAAALLRNDSTLKTVGNYPPFLTFLQKTQGQDWFVEHFAEIPEIQAVFPDSVSVPVWNYLVRPTQSPAYVKPFHDLAKKFFDEYVKPPTTGILKANERIYGAYLELRNASENVYKLLNVYETQMSLVQPTLRRRIAAENLITKMEKAKSSDRLIERKLADPIQAAAKRALEYWMKADDLLKLITGEAKQIVLPEKQEPAGDPAPAPTTTPAEPPTPASIPEVPEKVWKTPLYQAFIADVNKGLTGILGISGGIPALLDAKDYQSALETLRSAMVKHRKLLSDHIRTIIVWSTSANADKFDEAVWFAVAQLVIDRLITVVGVYDAKREGVFDDRYGGLPDVRLSHRFDMARETARLAKFSRSTELMAAADTIMAGTDLGYSYFAFTGDWKRDPVVLSEMSKDLNESLPIGGFGGNVGQVVRIYKLLRTYAINTALQGLLETYKNTYPIESYGLIAQAQKTAREQVPYPVRWIPEKSFVVWNESDKDTVGKQSLYQIIAAHPRYVELTAVEENLDRLALMSAVRAERPLVWMLPKFDLILNYVYSIPLLKDLLETRVGVDATLDEILWALDSVAMEAREARRKRAERAQAEGKEFKDIPLTPIEEELEAIYAAITGQSKTELTHATRVRDNLYLQATIHDRKTIEKAAGDLLDQYADNDDASNYRVPIRALDLIDTFARNIVPDTPEHKSAEMALLILSLADNLENAFIEDDEIMTKILGSVTEDRADIITGYWRYLNDTIDFAEGKTAIKKQGDEPYTHTKVADLMRPYVSGESPEVLLIFGTANLRILRDAFRQEIIRHQMKGGIIGATNPERLERVDGKGSIAIGWENPMMYEGISYAVTKVHRDFRFHPAYGRHGIGSYVPSILKDTDDNDIPRRQDIVLLTYSIDGGDEQPLTASLDDENRLEMLATAAVIHDIVQNLMATASLIESAFKLGRDVASLFVPGGPGIVLLMDMAEFMMRDMPVIRENIIDAPMKAVRALEEFIAPEMRDRMIEKLWIYLLFEGDLPFAESLMAMSKKKGTNAAAHRKGKFAKMAMFAKNVGLRLLETFFALQIRVRAGMIRASRFVQRKPLLKRLVLALPQIIAAGSTISGKDIDKAREVLGDLVDGDVPTQISKSLRNALDELFTGLRGMEVPSEILPLDLVVEIVMERLIRTMGVKGKIVQKLMQVSTFQQKAAEKVAEVLRDNGLDPNILWQETIQDELQGMLNEAREEMIAGVNILFKKYLGDFFTVPSEGLETIEIAKDKDVPKLEPLLSPSVSLDEEGEEREYDTRRQHAPKIDPHMGQPLPIAMREHYEGIFGHDFTHVRLHGGHDAVRLTRHYHADALTSGSHIFLSKNVPHTSARGDKVLRHEMAHVLQQTGARPLGYKHDPDPTLGDTGQGLQVNPRREHAADQMARAAVTRGTDPVPVQEEDLLGGLLPALSDEIQKRVIEYLGNDKLANTFVEQVESLKSVPAKVSVQQRGQFEAAVTAAETIWNDVNKLLKTRPTGGALKNPSPFDKDPAIEGTKTFFGANPVDMRRNPIIRALAFYSFHEKAGKLVLDFGRYKTNLENYLYAKTGVDIKIDYRATAPGRTPDVDYVRINYIDLGDVSGHSKLYSNMKKATDKHMASPGSTLGAPFTAVEWGKIRDNLRGGIAERETWDNNEYRLSNGFINEMREYVNATGLGQVDKWENYVKTDDVANPLYGGLRVGTHGQLRGAPTGSKDLEPQSGPGSGSMNKVTWAGRQSHHLPQFLLVEYFEDDNRNTVSRSVKGKETFPPGFLTSGSRATGFSDGSSPKLDFQKLDPNSERGAGLPAVSLAAKTHQKGQLHIVSATTWGDYRKPRDDIEITGTGSQGATINKVFYDLLKKQLSGVKGIGASTDDATVLEKANENRAENAPKVLKAVQQTYMWMYKGMKHSLQRTLTKNVTDEQHYEALSYRAFAMSMPDTTQKDAEGNIELKPGYRPSNIGLSDVVQAVENKNRTIMKDWWTT